MMVSRTPSSGDVSPQPIRPSSVAMRTISVLRVSLSTLAGPVGRLSRWLSSIVSTDVIFIGIDILSGVPRSCRDQVASMYRARGRAIIVRQGALKVEGRYGGA